MKKILSITVALLLLAYMVCGIVMLRDKNDLSRECQGVYLTVKDSLEYCTVNRNMVMGMLRDNWLDPTGKPVGELLLDSMERVLCRHPFIATAQCYLTQDDMLRIDITGKMPIARVRNNRGQDFYIDNKRCIMPCRGIAVNVPVVTGEVSKQTVTGPLFDLLLAIDGDEFWKAQIEQINVTSKGQVQLVPRLGMHILELGDMRDFQNKLERLANFYDKGMDKIGWNKYSSISVAYQGQVVCKKWKR